jgi:hypothetical protein
LGKSEAQELIEAGEAFDFIIAAIFAHAFAKIVQRQMIHDLRKNGWAGVHGVLRVRRYHERKPDFDFKSITADLDEKTFIIKILTLIQISTLGQ